MGQLRDKAVEVEVSTAVSTWTRLLLRRQSMGPDALQLSGLGWQCSHPTALHGPLSPLPIPSTGLDVRKQSRALCDLH